MKLTAAFLQSRRDDQLPLRDVHNNVHTELSDALISQIWSSRGEGELAIHVCIAGYEDVACQSKKIWCARP